MTRNWRAEFARTAKTFDWEQIHALSTQYVDELNGQAANRPKEVAGVLGVLRTNLRYEDLELVADAALAHDLRAPVVRRQYAQALVDGGNPALALLVYQDLASDEDADQEDRLEACGGVGRCNKELFLACSDPERRRRYLRASLDAYLETFTKYGRPYHGINAVAMLVRAQKEGVEPDAARGRRVAEKVLHSVENAAADDGWGQLTACEALIALGRSDDALQYAESFVETIPGAFHVASFLRQLTQVWQLDTTDELGHRLLPVLRSALLTYAGGEVVVESRDISSQRLHRLDTDSRFEAVLGDVRFKNLQWYRNGLVRCRAVARILTVDRDPIGTGFLMAGATLHEDLPNLVLVTNGHVVPEKVKAEKAIAVFHGADAGSGASAPEFCIARTWWYRRSGDIELDTTIVELTGYPHNVEPLPLAEPLGAGPVTDQRAYVIGHPTGLDQPQFSLQDNLLLEYNARVLRYRSPTEHGSSGSPVFDDDWGLIGVHHSTGTNLPRLTGGGTGPANEGIRVDAIRDRLKREPPTCL